MIERRRFKSSRSLGDRLAAFAEDARAEAGKLPPSLKRDELERNARQADTAARLDEWVNSPGLQPPTK